MPEYHSPLVRFVMFVKFVKIVVKLVVRLVGFNVTLGYIPRLIPGFNGGRLYFREPCLEIEMEHPPDSVFEYPFP
jgi:hypothetical protein